MSPMSPPKIAVVNRRRHVISVGIGIFDLALGLLGFSLVVFWYSMTLQFPARPVGDIVLVVGGMVSYGSLAIAGLVLLSRPVMNRLIISMLSLYLVVEAPRNWTAIAGLHDVPSDWRALYGTITLAATICHFAAGCQAGYLLGTHCASREQDFPDAT